MLQSYDATGNTTDATMGAQPWMDVIPGTHESSAERLICDPNALASDTPLVSEALAMLRRVRELRSRLQAN